jgi:predicted MFS family arabinose efflux permease
VADVSAPESTSHPRRVLAVVSGGNFAQLGARFLLSPVVPFVLADLDTTKSAMGLALTGLWGVYALTQFPSGVLADRFGERPLLLAGLVGTAVGMALIAVAPSFALYGTFVLVLGVGTGLFFAPASSLLSRLFAERGAALGWLTAAGALAGVAYPAVGSYVGDVYGWRVAVGIGAVVAVPALAATVAFVPRVRPAQPERRFAAAVDLARIRGLLSRPSVAYTTLLAIVVSFTFQGVSSFLPTFLIEYRGLDPTLAGVAFGVVFGLSTLSQPVAGRVSDRLSRDVAIAASVAVTAVGIVVLLVVPGTAGVVVGTGVLGVGIAWPGVLQARFMDQFSDDERGYGFGLARTTYMFLAAPGSVVVGTLADTTGWVAGYGVVVALLCLGLVLLGANRALDLGL